MNTDGLIPERESILFQRWLKRNYQASHDKHLTHYPFPLVLILCILSQLVICYSKKKMFVGWRVRKYAAYRFPLVFFHNNVSENIFFMSNPRAGFSIP